MSTFFNKNHGKRFKIEITNLELHFVLLYLTSHTEYQWNQKDTDNCNSHPDNHRFHTPRWHKNLREFSSIKYSILDMLDNLFVLFCETKIVLTRTIVQFVDYRFVSVTQSIVVSSAESRQVISSRTSSS